jgi:DNA-binding MurR/RpiR family transcriptional regulator
MDPPAGGTIDHIVAVLPSLIPSEQRVARACVEHPEEVVELSGAGLATRTGTSPATVSRACQNLGFRGFQHLRLLLVRDLAVRAQSSAPSAEGTAGRLGAYADGAAEMISTALTTVDVDAFDAATATIAGARRLLLIASGGSAPAAQAVALKFLMNGRSCEAPVDAVVQELTASVLTPGDVCLVVSESGSNSVTLRAATAGAEAGATVVAVTGYAHAPIADLADLVLVAGARYQSWDRAAVGGNLVQLLLLSVLQSAVAERMSDSDRARAAAFDEVVEIVARDPEAADRTTRRDRRGSPSVRDDSTDR